MTLLPTTAAAADGSLSKRRSGAASSSRRKRSSEASATVSPIFTKSGGGDNDNGKIKKGGGAHNFLLGGQQPMGGNKRKTKRVTSSWNRKRRHHKLLVLVVPTILLLLCFLVVFVVWSLVWGWVWGTTGSGSLLLRRKTFRFHDPALLNEEHLYHNKAMIHEAKQLHKERLQLNYGGRFDALIQQLVTSHNSNFQLPQGSAAVHEKLVEMEETDDYDREEEEEEEESADSAAEAIDDDEGNNNAASNYDDDDDSVAARTNDDSPRDSAARRKLAAATANSKPTTPSRSMVKKQRRRNRETKKKDGATFAVRPLTDLLHHQNPAPAEQTRDNHPAAPAIKRKSATTLATMDKEPPLSQCPPLEAAKSEKKIQTTLVVQSTLDRAWILQETCRRWSDPIVAVIALTEAEARPIGSNPVIQGLKEWRLKCPQITILTHTLPAEPQEYPVNYLRNLGLSAVTTSHLLVSDVDLVPSQELAQTIRETLQFRKEQQQKNQGAWLQADREALIVPAFERRTPCQEEENDCLLKHHLLLQQNSSVLPLTFEALRSCMTVLEDDSSPDEEPACAVFQSLENWEGHYSTHSSRWLAEEWYQETYDNETTKLVSSLSVDESVQQRDVVRLQCFDSLRYEPYVVIPWCPMDHEDDRNNAGRPLAPFYDERFHGYGKNKIQYISHLRFLQYQFAILPKGFLVHNPHPPSQAKQEWAGSGSSNHQLHRDMDQLYPKFLGELARKYFPSEKEFSWLQEYPRVVGLCPAARKAIRRMQKQQQRARQREEADERDSGQGDEN